MPRTAARTRRPPPRSSGVSGLGARLRSARAEAGLSQAQLGAPHYTRAHVSAIELGKIRPGLESLEFLARKLGKPAGWFLGDDATAGRGRSNRATKAARAWAGMIAAALRLLADGKTAEAIATLTRLRDQLRDARRPR